jgi:deoxyribodipyrimidine photolyase-related protein
MPATGTLMQNHVRYLVLVLGDQLDIHSSALADFDPARDRVLMIEAESEARHVWSHKARIAMFLAAMRHFAAWLGVQKFHVDYVRLNAEAGSLTDILRQRLLQDRPQKLIVVEPGEYRLEQAIRETCKACDVPIAIRDDTHFLASRAEFAKWARGYKQLRMEFFYRSMRLKTGVLMTGKQPVGGQWNYDSDNRRSFGAKGPPERRAPLGFPPDDVTRDVILEVEKSFADHPGSLDSFAWPVTRDDALKLLDDFVQHRLPNFGDFQDAMWSGEPALYHSLLSAALNLKLLNPREVINAALAAYDKNKVGLASVEGFIRQILGWREFIRGVYWLDMPQLLDANHFDHRQPLPKWYWTGATHMNCMRQVIAMTLTHGYSHHIQRLMVTGMFGILAEIRPRELHEWYLAMYVDAVEWVEAPNTLGMALYANGGRFTSKPYVASGAYINRMSNFCKACRYRPDEKTGPNACPVTVLYWSFLDKHETTFALNPRTSLMIKNLAKLAPEVRASIRNQARTLLESLDGI